MSPDDRLALLDLVGRYALAVDGRDVAGVAAVFDVDARLEFVSTGTVHVGRDAIAAFFAGGFAAPPLAGGASTHLMANTVIDPIDADTAAMTTSCVAYLATHEGVVARGLTYADRAERTPDGWRLVERIHRLHWQAEMPGGVTAVDPLFAGPYPSQP
jgi:hypothetical protein